MKNANLPPIEVYIWNRFLYDNDSNYDGKTSGHLMAVRARQNQALQFTVLLENGALFTGLPSNAITFREDCPNPILNLQDSQMWDCVSDDVEVFCIESLRYAQCEVLGDQIAAAGMYLFTVDFVGEGYSRHPTHWKQLHAVQTLSGDLLLYPQYRIIFLDKALNSKKPELPRYKANTRQWIVGS
jgi:hypothetical protein